MDTECLRLRIKVIYDYYTVGEHIFVVQLKPQDGFQEFITYI